MTEHFVFKFNYLAILVSINLPTKKRKPVELYQPVYVSGIKHKPFTFVDYVNVIRPPFDGLVMRSGGFRRGELIFIASGCKCGKSVVQSEFMESLR